MADLLCELFTEEIPARFQVGAQSAFLDAITKGLQHSGLAFDSAHSLSTPRRLAVIIKGLPIVQADTRDERKGPNVKAPEHALQGFLKSVGLQQQHLEIRNTPKGQVYFAVIEKQGRATATVLPDIINTAILNIPWGKSMRFSDYTFRFVRPLQRIVCVFDGELVAGELPLGNTRALAYTDKTLGHRFMASGDIRVDADTYETALADAHVVVNRDVRKQQIVDGLHSQADAKGVRLIIDKGLLEEVVGLVETPVVLMGNIPQEFMRLPKEVLITSLKQHQKFFVFEHTDGTLAPYFATVANIKASDGGKAIVQGNEKVLNARLSDSVFFYDNDIQNWDKYTNNAGLENMTFHAKLGTVKDRVYRIERLSRTIAEHLQYDEKTTSKVGKSASICKSDLVSEMVFEFPELQGIMGSYYAQNAGDDVQIANAIRDHYKPRGANDAVPTDAVAIPVAIAEKLDTLCGFWYIGEKPTGSKDPYALRRCALGILRIILENKFSLDIMSVVAKGLEVYGEMGITTNDVQSVQQDLQVFLIERLKHALKSEGIRHDYIGAVLSNGLDENLIYNIQFARVMAKNSTVVSRAKSAYVRAKNILDKATDIDGKSLEINPNILQSEDKALYAVIQHTENSIQHAHKQKDYHSIINILSALNEPLDVFFKNVMVNVDDVKIRNNRLSLLYAVTRRFNNITNFNIIEK